MYTIRLFSQGADLFGLKFYPDRVVPINNFRHQKTRDTGLPDGEDSIPLHFLILTQYRSVLLHERAVQSVGGVPT